MSTPTTPVDPPASHPEEEVARPHLGCQAAEAPFWRHTSDDDSEEPYEDEPEEPEPVEDAPVDSEHVEPELEESEPSEEDPTETEPLESDPMEEDPEPDEDDDPVEDSPGDRPTTPTVLPDTLAYVRSPTPRAEQTRSPPRYYSLSGSHTTRGPKKSVPMPHRDPYSPVSLLETRVVYLERQIETLQREIDERAPTDQHLMGRMRAMERTIFRMQQVQGARSVQMNDLQRENHTLIRQLDETLSYVVPLEQRVSVLEHIPAQITQLITSITAAIAALQAHQPPR